MSANPIALQPDPLLENQSDDKGSLVSRNLVLGHLGAGVFFLIYALLTGFAYALFLWGAYPFPTIGALSAGKLGLVYTNVLVLGFLFNMYWGALYWVVPAIMKRRVLSELLGNIVLGLWNLAVVLTIFGIQDGFAQTLPWGETPNGLVALLNGSPHIYFADELILISVVLAIAQFFVPLASAGLKHRLPVAGWFITAGLIWFLLIHTTASYGFELFTGAAGAVFAGVYAQGIIGLTLSALAWGIMYYFVPATLHTPIWSYSVALLGFWALALFSPMSSLSTQLGSTIPTFALDSGVVFSVAVQLATLTLLINFFMTYRRSTMGFREISTRYIYAGMVLYSVAAIIGMFTVQSTMQTLTQFTEWQVAHQFMVLYGVFGFWALGIWQDLLPRLAGKEGWFSDEVNEWGFWLNLIGVGGFVTAGLVGGIAEGGLWQSNVSWAVILDAMATFWEFQLLMLGVIIVANAFLIYNSVMTLLPAATIQELTRTAE